VKTRIPLSGGSVSSAERERIYVNEIIMDQKIQRPPNGLLNSSKNVLVNKQVSQGQFDNDSSIGKTETKKNVVKP
jgi:hypothetical protein